MSTLLDRLEALGLLQPVDVALGRLLAQKSASDGAVIGIAAALVSAARERGHSCLPLGALHDFVADEMDADVATCETILRDLPRADALRAALSSSSLVAYDATTAAALVLDVRQRLYLGRYFRYETTVAQTLRARLEAPAPQEIDEAALRAALNRYFPATADGLDREQCIAALLAARSRFLLITGGPGTGKTTTVLRLLAILIEQAFAKGEVPPRIALAAPTGKAAARLSETLRTPLAQANVDVAAALPTSASTVHRLIGLSAGQQQARYHGGRPLAFDLVVVDEASMLDLALAARLCAALAPDTRLILLGDRDQLASVEAGSVFGALCAAAGATNRYSPATATMLQKLLGAEVESSVAAAPLTDALVELRHSHRFSASSAIGRFAGSLRRGAYAEAQGVLEECTPELQTRMVAERDVAASVVRQFAPRFASLAQAPTAEIALDQLDGFRVLCALRSGPCGAETINALIEQQLHRGGARDDGSRWFAGRLVMISSNDPRQGLFNGDIGIALPSGAHGAFEVWFRGADGGMLRLAPALLPVYRGAFALTVHKAQGSEFDEVLVVLPAHDARVLSRELLYTAVTRARKKVELWTNPQILETTIARTTGRWSGLAEKLGTQA